MKIRLILIDPPERKSWFYKDVIKAFKVAKKRDDWNIADLCLSCHEVYYRTCNDNIFTICDNPSGIFFSFDGTRESFARLKPFEGYLQWVSQKKKGQDYILSLKTKRSVEPYDLKTVEYQTTAPEIWELFPLDWIEKINETEAVIHRFNRIEDAPTYVNVYV